MGKRKPREGSAEAAFLSRLDNIESRANAQGVKLQAVCAATGVARATPERWRKSVPHSVLLLDKLDNYVAELEAESVPRATK